MRTAANHVPSRVRAPMAVSLVALAVCAIGLAPGRSAQAATGRVAACNASAFFRVTAMRLEVVRKGTWRAPDRAMDAVERDTVLGPGRRNVHPIPFSPPVGFGCSAAFYIRDVLPVRSVLSGSWQDFAPWPASVPRSGTCSDNRLFREGQSPGLNLRAPIRTRGTRVTFRLALDLKLALTCEVPDRTASCPPDAFDCNPDSFFGNFDGSGHFFQADSSGHRFLPGAAGSLAANAVMRRTTLTVPFSGRFVYQGTWKPLTADRPDGTERIDVTWSGSMTLKRFALCHRGQPLRRCLPRRPP